MLLGQLSHFLCPHCCHVLSFQIKTDVYAPHSVLPDRVALRVRHQELDQVDKLVLDKANFPLQRAIFALSLLKEVLNDLSPVVPHRREVWRQLCELFCLTQRSFIVDFVLALFQHLSIHCFDLDKLLISLLGFFRRELLRLLLFPSVKHGSLFST